MEQNLKTIQSRETGIDLMESIAILLVLLGHSTIYSFDILFSKTTIDYLRYYLRGFIPCSVPIFFFANGYLLLNRPFNLRKHIYRIIRLLVLTAIWGILTVVCYMPIKGVHLSVPEIIMKVWHFEEGWTNHLWFMGALICVYIFFPLLKLAWDNSKPIFLFFSIVAFAMTIGNKAINEGLTIFSSLVLNKETAYEGLNFFNLFNPFRYIRGYTFAYFCAGGFAYLLKDKLLSVSAWKRNLIASLVLFFSSFCLFKVTLLYSNLYQKQADIVWNNLDSVFTFINVICIFVLCLNYKKDIALIRNISGNTLGIYFLHGILINATIDYVMLVPAFQNIFSNVIYDMLILFLCLGIILVLKKIPVLRGLVTLK